MKSSLKSLICQILGNIHDFDAATESIAYEDLPVFGAQQISLVTSGIWQLALRIDQCMIRRAEAIFDQMKEVPFLRSRGPICIGFLFLLGIPWDSKNFSPL